MIPGVSIDLKKAKPGEEFAVNISEDTAAVGTKVSDLVTKLNGILKFIKEQNSIDDKTDTSRTLGGDIMLQSLEGRIHAAVFKDVQTDTGFHRVGELGLSFSRDGVLEFDQKKFDALISKDYTLASQILTGTFISDGGKSDGFMDNLNSTMNSALRMPDGIIQNRKKSLQSNIEQIDRRISQKQKYLEEKEKNLKDKFSRLEGTISRIKSQGAGIAGMSGGGGSPVQELG
jgi:flagellar hook-associated protein 2